VNCPPTAQPSPVNGTEIFPLETRALAIACFYALGTAIGASISALRLGWLIQSQPNLMVSGGYLLAASWLLAAAVNAWKLRVDAEGKSLESIADLHQAEA
jgi:hypothetical protein